MADKGKITVAVLGGLLTVSILLNCWQFIAAVTGKPGPVVATGDESPPTLGNSRVSLQQSAMVWLQRQNFAQAIAAMDRLRDASSEQAAALEINWLQELHNHLEQDDFDFVQAAVTALLEAYPYNENYMLLQAELLEQSGQTRIAASAYYELADQPSLDNDEPLQSKARELAITALDELQNQQDWTGALQFLDELLWREPEYPPYVMALVKVHMVRGDMQQAQLHLDRLAASTGFEEEIGRLAEQMQLAQQPSSTQLALSAQRNHLLVPITLGGAQQLQLMLDTGASLSVINEQRLSELPNAQFLRSVTMNTAGGKTQADVYQINDIQIGPYALASAEFAVLPLVDISGDGLLGMNILQQFRFNIDTDAKLLGLTPKIAASN